MYNDFRTIVNVGEAPIKITYRDNIILMGSCFTENIGSYLHDLRFNTLQNPFGILFNPKSIENCIIQIAENKRYSNDDLLFFNNLWISLSHHGCFSNKDKDICLSNINSSINAAHEFLKSTTFLYITFGTSIVYNFIDTGEVVGNCHKIPGNKFTSRRLSLHETVDCLSSIVELVTKINPDIHIVFTISPIRHWKDGATENQRSKSTLILAVAEAEHIFKNVDYFPAYEIMNDDLRDYRFYSEDMIHPGISAINYIRQRFTETFIDESCFELIKLIDKLNHATNHRIQDPLSSENDKFREYVDNLKTEIDKSLSYHKNNNKQTKL